MAFTEDRRTVIKILEFTGDALTYLIEHVQDPDERELFLRAWKEETHQDLDFVLKQLDSMQEGDPTHQSLRRAGLTGHSLRLKAHYLGKAARTGWRTKLLELLNKFLGSLASGIPGAEPVKELKEWLEDVVKDRPEPDSGIISIFRRHS